MRILLVLFLFVLTARATFFDTSWDWEARRWQTNIVTSGGTISDSSYLTGVRFMNQVKQWGLRPLLGRVNLYLGNQTNAMLCPIITDWTAGGADNNDDLIAFAAADYDETIGLTGNTTSKYLRCSKSTGIGLGSFTSIDNVHSAVYVRTGSNEAGYSAGYASAANCSFGMPISYSGQTHIEINLTPPNNGVVSTNAIGFFLSTRVVSGGGTNRTTYQNTTNIVTSAVCNGNLGSGQYVVHAFNSAGVITAWTSRTLSYYGLGYGIPPALVAPYNIAVQNGQQAKGRRVP
jgi:hypothetical protein